MRLILQFGKRRPAGDQFTILIHHPVHLAVEQDAPVESHTRVANFSDGNRSRFEIQLQGQAVPFKKFRNLHKYVEADLLHGVHFRRLPPISGKGEKLPANHGFRLLVMKHGQQATAKLLGPAHWAYARKRHLHPFNATKMPDIRALLRKSIEAWLEK